MFQVLLVNVVCDWLIFAMTNLCIICCVNCDNVSRVLLPYVTLCIVTNDQVGDVYRVNCDNVTKVLLLYVILHNYSDQSLCKQVGRVYCVKHCVLPLKCMQLNFWSSVQCTWKF